MTVDVAVVDFAMPRMNGAALAQAARRLQPGLPIVFATGYADTAAFEAVPGAAILRKPIQIAQLADAVRRTLQIKSYSASQPHFRPCDTAGTTCTAS
jgi:DNA-binding LytR/AlgR family response regulator